MNNLQHDISSTSDYMRGAKDAREGFPAESGASEDYDSGYGDQYSAEQALCAFGLKQDNKMSIFG